MRTKTGDRQWQRVYLVGLEQDTLPSYYADTPLSLREERRACFVGICRAEEHLEITHAATLNGWQTRKLPISSRCRRMAV
jgi:DNA helicase-2/ATP-dependent DNA helicase PcrA